MNDSNKLNLSHLKAEDLMKEDIFIINPQMTVREAIELMIQNQISGAPIANVDRVVLSVISESDLMKFAISGGLDSKIHTHMGKLPSVSALITAQKKTPFVDVLRTFLEKNVRRIIIIDLTGRLQGIIARRDVISTYLKYEGK